MEKPSGSSPIRASRAVYDPAIRETITAGNLDHMKTLLTDAKELHRQQGDLGKAIARLEAAIRAAS
ncbi:DUF1843 domain-containing protein [Sphingomonas sp. QA11]|uniref:DUF1843 domain-containing protein n=1 Tax=Sphingomonas sp. QA11 TaxID=2950605 RepID=UPI00234A6A2A|nr:DUF1843 domain-containing protein [Sphingomonas sp. QA11]WCM25053.1 DUF1843 domain-containing protein [Sphingomonas sp. QA11]